MSESEKKKPAPEVASIFKSLSAVMPVDEKAAQQWPVLWEVLLPKYRENVCTRQPGALRIKVEGTYFRVFLEAPTEGLQATLLVEHLDGLLDRVEAFLTSRECNWVPNYDRQKKSRPVIENLL